MLNAWRNRQKKAEYLKHFIFKSMQISKKMSLLWVS